MDKIEVGKYYRLQDRYYFCPVIQMFVKFQDPVIVKLTHTHLEQAAYGDIVKTSKYGDEQTNVDIEMCEKDIINEHQFKEYEVPGWMEFKFDESKISEAEVQD